MKSDVPEQTAPATATILEKVMSKYTLEQVQPQPIYIESSGRWEWPLPERACFPGCCTSVVTASREWWEYAPSEAKPHPMSEAIQLRDGVWYWTIPDAILHERESAKAAVTDEMVDIALTTMYGEQFADISGKAEEIFRQHMRAALEASTPMLVSESSEELKEWEEFGREIEKLLRYNPWGFKGSYPEIINQVMKLASARVPDEKEDLDPVRLRREGRVATEWERGFNEGWNDCRDAMLAAAPKSETEE